jgi:hypothetical protein
LWKQLAQDFNPTFDARDVFIDRHHPACLAIVPNRSGTTLRTRLDVMRRNAGLSKAPQSRSGIVRSETSRPSLTIGAAFGGKSRLRLSR